MRIFTFARPVIYVLAALSALSACGAGGTTGGTVDKAALIATMKKESEMKDAPDAMLDCMAAVMMKHGDQATLQGIVDGKVMVKDNFKAFGAKEKQVQDEVWKCA
ncbi:hypothetical protein AB0I81_33160 [Nonomuraea sp. NPDC050404]|uniref:hypothetical protein n=1 Tax=Nonomuraea sp. NPDC050404 TaxID=3155783 RepID=UPI0033FC0897